MPFGRRPPAPGPVGRPPPSAAGLVSRVAGDTAEPGPAPMAPTPAWGEAAGQYSVVTVAPLKAAAAWRLM